MVAAAIAVTAVGVYAHPITYRGTVAKVEAGRIQVKTIDEDGNENPEPEWFSPNDETKILRGETRMTLQEADITVGERIVVIVNHRADDDIPVVEVRLAPKRADATATTPMSGG